MRRPLYLPNAVRSAISAHLRERLGEIGSRYDAAAEDEDAFTGFLGGLLGCSDRVVRVDKQEWRWRIEFTKFRGRGPDATETSLGADGIFEVVVSGNEGGRKAMLFQSKMGAPADRRALAQAAVLSNWREAAAFFGYARERISVYPLDDVFQAASEATAPRGAPFLDFVDNVFLACFIGDSDLSYEPRTRTLRWRDENGQLVEMRFRLPHRLRVAIKPPYGNGPRAHHINAQDLEAHRMDSTPEQRLGLTLDASDNELTAKKRTLARAYHPDRHQLDAPTLNILNARVGEITKAYAEIKKNRQRGR